MLDRKAMPILSVLILVMLVGDVWLITHDARRSMALFIPSVTMMIVPGVFVLKERRAVASADVLAAWKKWGSFFLISCAAIVTAFQLLPVFHRLGIPLPSPELCFRLFVASYGLIVVVSGNRAPKLPPLEWRWHGMLSLGKEAQVAISRLAGWLLVSFGVTTIVIALFLPVRLIAPVMGSLALATLVALLVKHRQLRSSKLAH
jgi:hypothetical protein